MKLISYLCSWLTLDFCSTLSCGTRRKRRDVKNLKSTLLDEKINEVSSGSLANAQDLRRRYLQVTPLPPFPRCVSTQKEWNLGYCEAFSLLGLLNIWPFLGHIRGSQCWGNYNVSRTEL